MQIFDTLSGEKKTLEISPEKELKFFVCGQTVYDHAHLGSARTYIAFDIIVRYLRSLGQKVNYLQNITDIDDKIIDRAKQEKIMPQELAKKFEREYLRDMASLGVDQVTQYARATDHISEIIKQIESLKEKGNAYEIPSDGIYFDLSTFPDYGKLSHRTVLQAEDSISRVDESVHKRNKGDFALWKFPKTRTDADSHADGRGADAKLYDMRLIDGEPAWFTPLGWGRPGWHIEDTAITEHYFGPQYDIHGGGIDLKFPHHEAEIAQQEAASGKKPFVNIWMHTGPLLVNGQKMSKSLGNFVTIKDFLKEHSANILRWIIVSHHYRSPIDYTDDLVTQARGSLARIQKLIRQLKLVKDFGENAYIETNIKNTEKTIQEDLAYDFNTPSAIAQLFGIIGMAQEKMGEMKVADAQKITAFIKSTLSLFGLNIKIIEIDEEIHELVDSREKLRKEKNFSEADQKRKEIEQKGYKIDDTIRGPFIYPKDLNV